MKKLNLFKLVVGILLVFPFAYSLASPASDYKDDKHLIGQSIKLENGWSDTKYTEHEIEKKFSFYCSGDLDMSPTRKNIAFSGYPFVTDIYHECVSEYNSLANIFNRIFQLALLFLMIFLAKPFIDGIRKTGGKKPTAKK